MCRLRVTLCVCVCVCVCACVLQVDVCKLRRRCEGWHVLSFVHGHLGDDDANAHAVVSLPPRFESIDTVEYPWDVGCGMRIWDVATYMTYGVTYGVTPEHQMSYYGDCGFNGELSYIHRNKHAHTSNTLNLIHTYTHQRASPHTRTHTRTHLNTHAHLKTHPHTHTPEHQVSLPST